MFTILFVCAGNRIRSPLAAAFLRDLTEGLPVEVFSAGTLDLGPRGPLAETLWAGRGLGVDLAEHQTTFLGNARAQDFDLVIGFDLSNVAAAVVDHRASPERVFLLKELVGLLEILDPPVSDSPTDGARDALARAHELRGEGNIPVGMDIADPYGASAAVVFDVAQEIQGLCARLSRQLFSTRSGRPRG